MPVPIRRRSSRKRTIQTINEATGFDADFLNFSPGLADFAIASGLPLADSQELDSQDLVGAALYANGLFLDSALGEPPSELDERTTSEIPKLPELPAPPVALGPEDEQSVNSEVAMVRRRKEVKKYGPHTFPPASLVSLLVTLNGLLLDSYLVYPSLSLSKYVHM